MKKLMTVLAVLAALSFSSSAQVRHRMNIPDIPGYITLKGDMHMHTAFSDGSVWPSNRIDECVWEGLDVLCITDHVDGRLQKYSIDGTFNTEKVNRNTSYEIASKYAKDKDVIVIHGGEISSQIMPPGHFNVLFTKDNVPIGNAMDAAGKDNQPKGQDAALRIAKEQGAFMTWNHPNWCRQAPNQTVIYPLHEQYRKEGLLNAVEIFNWWDGYCPEGHHWAVENGLTLVSGTDSHHPMFMDIDFFAGELRPVTLIFSTSRNAKGVREALDNQRTAVFAEGKVYGDRKYILPLLESCLKIEKVTKSKTKLAVYVHNDSSIPIILDKAPGSEQWQISRHLVIHPGEYQEILVYRLNKSEALNTDVFELHFTVDNFFTDAGVKLNYCMKIIQQ